jgi:hypothetical protein
MATASRQRRDLTACSRDGWPHKRERISEALGDVTDPVRRSHRYLTLAHRAPLAGAHVSLEIAQVSIEPGEHFPHHICPLFGDIVRGVEKNHLLVGRRRAKHPNQRIFA